MADKALNPGLSDFSVWVLTQCPLLSLSCWAWNGARRWKNTVLLKCCRCSTLQELKSLERVKEAHVLFSWRRWEQCTSTPAFQGPSLQCHFCVVGSWPVHWRASEALRDCSSSAQGEQYCFSCQRKGAPRGFLKVHPSLFSKKVNASIVKFLQHPSVIL